MRVYDRCYHVPYCALSLTRLLSSNTLGCEKTCLPDIRAGCCRAGRWHHRQHCLEQGAGRQYSVRVHRWRRGRCRNLVTTAGNAKSRDYLIAHCGLSDDQIIDYKDGSFIEQAMQHNGGGFDVALDLVGGNMLSACCILLALDGNLASITEAPGQDDFEVLFQKNASFQ